MAKDLDKQGKLRKKGHSTSLVYSKFHFLPFLSPIIEK